MVSTAQLEAIRIAPKEVLRVVEDVLVDLARGRSMNPTKLAFETEESKGAVYAMAGFDGASRTVGFKSSYRFGATGSHTDMRYNVTLAIYDDRTGEPLAYFDAHHIGALRTPAVSALFARAMTTNPRTALVVGSGVQAQLALPFLVHACPTLQRVLINGTHAPGVARAAELLREHCPEHRLEVVDDPRAAAREADIVIGASGPRCARFVHIDDLKPGAAAILVGYGLDPDTLHQADYVLATHAEQMRITGADFANDAGELPDVDAELPDVLAGKSPARSTPGERVFAYNSGLVVTDIAVGRWFYDRLVAAENGAQRGEANVR